VSVATAANKAERQYRYRIDGHSITFEYTGGKAEKQWFFRYTDSDDEIGIGGSTFDRQKQ